MSTTLEEAKPRTPSQKQQIITLLRSYGSTGVTNKELQEICIRWTARISELYSEGYVIENVHLGNGLYNYTLVSEPKKKNNFKLAALDILLAEIKKKGLVSSNDLQVILEDQKLNIHRRSGSHKQSV